MGGLLSIDGGGVRTSNRKEVGRVYSVFQASYQHMAPLSFHGIEDLVVSAHDNALVQQRVTWKERITLVSA